MPTPLTVTVTADGVHAALSVYVTSKTNDVAVVPEPGEAVPFVSVSSCDAPPHHAARTGLAW